MLPQALLPDSTASRPAGADTTAFFPRFLSDLQAPTIWIELAWSLLHALVILALAWLTIRLVKGLVKRWARRAEQEALHHRQRTLTLGNLLSSATRYVVWTVACIMVLSEFGIDVGALLATAGVAGLAIGFGAQTLVRDVISGFFLLFDDTLHVGDVVRIGTDEGLVEHIGVRLIKVRKFSGELLMVPAGELRIFGNSSIDYVRVVVNVGLSYEQDLDATLAVMDQVLQDWAAVHRDIMLAEPPQVQAITRFGDSSVNARLVVQVKPGEQFQAERDLHLALKRAFDAAGIALPYPHRTVLVKGPDPAKDDLAAAGA
jgi:small conductance mechanosensitive channel